MDVSELKSIISRKLEIPISDIGREDFREYGVRFRYLGSSYRATTDLAVEKIEGGCLVTDDDARRIEKLLRTEEWDGEGLPPVGTVCEYIKKSLTVKEWTECTIDYVGSSFIVYRDCYGVELTSIKCDIEFRPIRSEADKKRDEAIKKICEVLSVGKNTEDDAKNIYEYIKSGKIVID